MQLLQFSVIKGCVCMCVCDSVPREALWMAMKKFGVPGHLIDVVKSFHEGMEARVWVGGELLEEIEVRNGLRQGCTMAPTLFKLYACSVVIEQRGWRLGASYICLL